MKKIKVTHRSTNEKMLLIQQSMLLKAGYTSKNRWRLQLEEMNRVVWVSLGNSTLWNRINSGMLFSEASVTFEIDESRVRKPNGLIKRLLGKSQRVIDGDFDIPSNAKFIFKE